MKPIVLSIAVLTIFASQSFSKAKQSSPIFPEYNIEEINRKAVKADSVSRSVVNRMDIVNGALLTTRQELSDIREQQEAISPARLEELETQVALLTEAFKDLYSIVAGIRVLPQIKYAPIKPSVPKGFNLSDAGDLVLGEEQSLYQRAMELYRTGRFTESRQLFTAQLEKYPTGSLADRASFWVGETYFSEKEYGQAINAYVSTEKFKGSSKCDDALYKQAVAYARLGENDTARELFNTLVGRYPSSEYADNARKHAEKLSL